MIITAKNINGEAVRLLKCVSLVLEQEQDVPADGLTVVFEGEMPLLGLVYLTLTHESGEIIFNGIVDEEEMLYLRNGIFTRLICRSLAAILLDNEALPQVYVNPDPALIFKRHAAPYGFTDLTAKKMIATGELTVEKGITEWDVIDRFSRRFLGVVPFASPCGTLDLSGGRQSRSIVFSNKKGGVKYSINSICHRRYPLVSKVSIKTETSGGYDLVLNNSLIPASGIVRKRYINACSDSPTGILTGEAILSGSVQKSMSAQLTVPSCVTGCVGFNVEFTDGGQLAGLPLYIKKLKYTLDEKSEKTVITLGKRVL